MAPRTRNIALASLFLTLPTIPASAETITIDASTIVNRHQTGESFERVAVLGQTFTVPTGAAFLTSFHFWIDDFSEIPGQPETGTPFEFRGYVSLWHETHPNFGESEGEPLYESGIRRTSEEIGFEDSIFEPSLPVRPGDTLVAFLAPIGVLGGDVMGAWTMGMSYCGFVFCEGLGKDYPGGHFAIGWWDRSRGVDWAQGEPFGHELLDAAFRATFTTSPDPVPEPATLFLVGTGVAAICRTAYRRNRRPSLQEARDARNHH